MTFLLAGEEGGAGGPDGALGDSRHGGQRQGPGHRRRGQLPGRHHLHATGGRRRGYREGGEEDEER